MLGSQTGAFGPVIRYSSLAVAFSTTADVNGDGSFQPSQLYPVGVNSGQPVEGDFDGDGKVDIAVPNGCGSDLSCSPAGLSTLSVLLGRGDGTFNAREDYPGCASVQSQPYLTAGDFNGDRRLDVATSCATIDVML